MRGPIAETSVDAPWALAEASRRLGVEVSRSDVEGALGRAGLGAVEGIDWLSGGHVNALLEIRLAGAERWVLKLGHPTFRPGKLLNEARALEQFRALGLPVPRLLFAETRGDALPVDWLVQEHIAGRPLGEALADGGTASLDLMAEAGRLLATIHGQPHGGEAFGVPGEDGVPGPIPWFGKADPTAPRGPFPTFAAWLEAELLEQLAGTGIGEGGRLADVLGPLAEAIRALGREVGELQPGPVHGDFTAANMLVAPDRPGGSRIVALLDWEWSHLGARELERVWAERSFAGSLPRAVRQAALERFREPFEPRTPSSELGRLAGGIVLLYELNAFDWIARAWPAERRQEELGRRLDAARRLARDVGRETSP